MRDEAAAVFTVGTSSHKCPHCSHENPVKQAGRRQRSLYFADKLKTSGRLTCPGPPRSEASGAWPCGLRQGLGGCSGELRARRRTLGGPLRAPTGQRPFLPAAPAPSTPALSLEDHASHQSFRKPLLQLKDTVPFLQLLPSPLPQFRY